MSTENSAFKLLANYCAQHNIPSPKLSVSCGPYGGKMHMIRIGDVTYKENREYGRTQEGKTLSLNAAVIIAFRDLLNL